MGSPQSHSFVVKIWAEEVRDPSRDAAWRGSVTHVGTGERVYVADLLHLVRFMTPYVRQLGGEPGLRSRLLTWLAGAPAARPPA